MVKYSQSAKIRTKFKNSINLAIE